MKLGVLKALQYAKTKEQVAKALFNQGVVLGKMGRLKRHFRFINRWMNAMAKIQTRR